jgi:hypothetical protein
MNSRGTRKRTLIRSGESLLNLDLTFGFARKENKRRPRGEARYSVGRSREPNGLDFSLRLEHKINRVGAQYAIQNEKRFGGRVGAKDNASFEI